MFIQEVLGCNAINGGQSIGLTSGLIDEIGFNNIYKYYWVNLERRSTDNVAPKSINITGINNNRVPIDLHIFVVTRKSVVLDVETGRLVSSSE